MSVLVQFVMSKWYAASNLVLNLVRTKIIEFVTNNSPQSALDIGNKENYVEETENKNFLVLQIITK